MVKKLRRSETDKSQKIGLEQDNTLLNVNSSQKDIERQLLGSDRIPIVEAYLTKKMDASTAAETLGIKLSGFYKIVRRVQASKGDLGVVVAKKPGPKASLPVFEPNMEAIIIESLLHYTGKAATIEKVWEQVCTLADGQMLPRPSYHLVRKRLQALGKRVLAKMKLGKATADDIYEARPGYKDTTRPLEWVQIDHTRMDLIVVDEDDRTIILGRPWISLAICIHTRVVLGFYLTLLPPSAISVAMLIENCVLPKAGFLASLGLDPRLWPMHGVPSVIHADNAAEFRSDLVKVNLKTFGVTMEHRDVGKKHQGGHIERLIGTMMTSKVHFLRGTTYSNTLQRGDEDSEGKAEFTLPGLRKFMVCAIHSYHERKHSGIRMSPADKWKKYYAQHAPPKQIEEARHENFRYVLYPEKMKVIRNGGIELHNRFYYAPIIQQKIRDSVLVKYDPYDVSSILVDLDSDGKYVKIPCYRNPFKRSSNYEIYRAQRQQKGERDGTLSKDGTASIALARIIENEEARLTAKSKKDKAREAAVKDYKKHSKVTAVKPKESGANELIDQTEHLCARSTSKRTAEPAIKTRRRSRNNKNTTSKTSRAQNSKPFVIREDWHATSDINYDQAPVIY